MRFLQPRYLIVAVAFAAAVIAGVLIAQSRSASPAAATGAAAPTESQVTWAAGARRAPDFSLTDRSGRQIARCDLLGHPWIANFIFTSCAGVCPNGRRRWSR